MKDCKDLAHFVIEDIDDEESCRRSCSMHRINVIDEIFEAGAGAVAVYKLNHSAGFKCESTYIPENPGLIKAKVQKIGRIWRWTCPCHDMAATEDFRAALNWASDHVYEHHR